MTHGILASRSARFTTWTTIFIGYFFVFIDFNKIYIVPLVQYQQDLGSAEQPAQFPRRDRLELEGVWPRPQLQAEALEADSRQRHRKPRDSVLPQLLEFVRILVLPEQEADAGPRILVFQTHGVRFFTFCRSSLIL